MVLVSRAETGGIEGAMTTRYKVDAVWVDKDSWELVRLPGYPYRVVLANDHDRDLAAKDDQWRKTNAEYERVSKENSRLLTQLAEKDRRIGELVTFYDEHHGTPCEQIRHKEQVHQLAASLQWACEQLKMERASSWADLLDVHIDDEDAQKMLQTDDTYQKAHAILTGLGSHGGEG